METLQKDIGGLYPSVMLSKSPVVKNYYYKRNLHDSEGKSLLSLKSFLMNQIEPTIILKIKLYLFLKSTP